jgi:DNA-binding transcriptional MerR regulator
VSGSDVTPAARGRRTPHRPLRSIDVARASGYSVQQVRLLERLGVLPPAPRSGSSYRQYSPVHVDAAIAYRDLAAAIGPVGARRLMRAVHEEAPERVLALIEEAYAALHRERTELNLARGAAEAVTDEPLADVRPSDAMTVAELADAIGVRTSTLRHWETEGLLRPERTEMGRRTYSPADVRDARVVQQLRAAGYRIPLLRTLLPRLRAGRGWEQVAEVLRGRDRDLDERSRHLLAATARIHALVADRWPAPPPPSPLAPTTPPERPAEGA